MLRITHSRLWALGALAMLMLALPATPASAARPANVRFVHAAPDVPAVDITIDGKSADQPLAFGTITEYSAVPAGKHKVRITIASAGITQALELSAAADGVYTIGLVGQLPELRLATIADHPIPPSEKGPQLRVYNFSPDAPAVDVRRADPAAAPGSVPDLLIANVGFANGSGYLPIPAGSYALTVMPATIDYLALNTPTAFQASDDTLQSMFILKTLSQQSTIDVKIVKDAVINRPSELPRTSTSQPSFQPLALLALVLLLFGGLLRRRAHS